MRRKVIAAVWKDRLSIAESVNVAQGINDRVGKLETNFDITLFPTPLAMSDVYKIIRDDNICLGAQDMNWDRDSGTYLGEIKATHLKELNCKYVMVGHSERRRFFGETDEMVNKRIRTAFVHQITPIVCLGVDLKEKESGLLEKIVTSQILGALVGLQNDFDPGIISNLMFAFEPVWAISTWREKVPLPEAEYINDVHGVLRQVLEQALPKSITENISVLYGGSVDPINGEAYFVQPNIDGALVGGASITSDSFCGVVEVGKRVYDA